MLVTVHGCGFSVIRFMFCKLSVSDKNTNLIYEW